ncbi:MAG: 1-acyl-sn-glycerol-3-phosphate acyltransferase [Clostridium sp.]|jgi:1-acyl-sn-glycerol-3-phosphate acyltransferase|uniref:lysophospholipid acyltransferase family protein n=1 Tax=Clostridium sp. TaxID=1506 RepID=UPI0025BACA3E|nr:lysophospholipid acyltransferase family protein [Clostridium sp.]MCH3965220.1 1-acyl-sn-glycerol-3-phosphate acyltransferase [Clostridium sp.]MCI1714440.1 1-acyl-sn-glycerol-3-phosphate acyltransferase [Clostridium sp.]MCI1798702.1 1-acyl-sn-glycerol-3-phosphate acyltransferase [Clostridium sp.]MCI1812567.1 1-acyl-sn-glycerol-3-phosphate acyltransferase [Clostridium sp.]MCI1869512.1 1-acyl-sn-glycerol-3-phosphate acyltransferase [Clostridium sp.]
MISPFMVKLIGCLPQRFLGFASKKILNGYLKKYADITTIGIENLNDVKRPILFLCNHLSNSDALVLGEVLKHENPIFVAGMKLNNNSLTKLGMSMARTIVIKPNSADKKAISSTVEALKSGENVLIFPEGTRSRTASLNKGKRGLVLIQKLTGASVVPVGIYGTEKFLPISDKDMALEKFHPAKITVNIGRYTEIPERNKNEGKHAYEERATDFLMYEIAKLLPEKYRGIYSFNEGGKNDK